MMFEINKFLGNFIGKDGKEFYDFVRKFCKIFYDSVNGYLDIQKMKFDLLCDTPGVKLNWDELGETLGRGYTVHRGGNDYFC